MATEQIATLYDWLSLGVDALTPIAVVLIGFAAKRYADKLEQRREAAAVHNQWRIELARELLDELNVLYQFFNYVGAWKDIDVDRATIAKRTCDRLIATNSFLWSKDFLQQWEAFRANVFVESVGLGRDFQFRANLNRHQQNPKFKPGWEARFVPPDERIARTEFRKLYHPLLEKISSDLGIRR